MKTLIVIGILLLCNFSFAQMGANISFNKSLIKTTGSLKIDYLIKKNMICLEVDYGLQGSFKRNDYEIPDAYSGIYNTIEFGNFYKFNGYEHRFLGASLGIDIARSFDINDKNLIFFGFGSRYYWLIDNYHHYYSTENDNSKTQLTKIKHQTFDVRMEISYLYKLNERVGVYTSLVLPWISFASKSPAINEYTPTSKEFPVYGLEPYLKLGINYRFFRNEE